MFDEYTLRLIEVFGAAFSAIATFTAIAVSLWLARRQSIKLRLYVDHYNIIGNSAIRSYIMFRITNQGERTARITSLGVRIKGVPFGLREATHFALVDLRSISGHPFPCALADGEEAMFGVDLSIDPNWVHKFYKKVMVDEAAALSRIRFVVYASAGQEFLIKPGFSLMKDLQKLHSVEGQECSRLQQVLQWLFGSRPT